MYPQNHILWLTSLSLFITMYEMLCVHINRAGFRRRGVQLFLVKHAECCCLYLNSHEQITPAGTQFGAMGQLV